MPPADRPIPAAPCPTCRRPPAARSGDVGRLVRCRGCGTRFRVALVAPTDGQAPAPDPDESDAPPDPPPAAANPYDDGYGRFDAVTTPGRVVALAVMHFVYCGLLSVCGVLSSVLVRVYPAALPGPDVAAGNRVYAHVLHGLMVVASAVLLTAGMLVLRRSRAGRAWTVAALATAGLLLLLSFGNLALNLPTFTGAPGETAGVMAAVVYHLVFWLGYVVPVACLLAAGRDLRAPPD